MSAAPEEKQVLGSRGLLAVRFSAWPGSCTEACAWHRCVAYDIEWTSKSSVYHKSCHKQCATHNCIDLGQVEGSRKYHTAPPL